MTDFDRLIQQYNSIHDQWNRGEHPSISQLAEHQQLKALECHRIADTLGSQSPLGKLALTWARDAELELKRLEQGRGLEI